MIDAGYSTCPICNLLWQVTIINDCMLPACGCYGNDTSAKNPNRPCEPCGIRHAINCLGKIEEELGDD
jgi:hypothetical protein